MSLIMKTVHKNVYSLWFRMDFFSRTEDEVSHWFFILIICFSGKNVLTKVGWLSNFRTFKPDWLFLCVQEDRPAEVVPVDMVFVAYVSVNCTNKARFESTMAMELCLLAVTLSCGESSSENCTYLVQTSKTTWTSTPCYYQICKVSSNVCRIRYDFTVRFILIMPSLL